MDHFFPLNYLGNWIIVFFAPIVFSYLISNNKKEDKIPFWSQNPNVIFQRDYIFEFFPVDGMTFSQKLNISFNNGCLSVTFDNKNIDEKEMAEQLDKEIKEFNKTFNNPIEIGDVWLKIVLIRLRKFH